MHSCGKLINLSLEHEFLNIFIELWEIFEAHILIKAMRIKLSWTFIESFFENEKVSRPI